ncbi:uncharacterized protein EAF01_011303 [Botrytis porri]|uniref:Uncharacterized protein n=1 Tax=Botrytis porri TaxID=87229 RepID=A0A4Z1KG13_9HELO|nr:uncharacterized protein EAF01_011303 [Botrytis porri]KAF7886625.1 hypothetical protein EAF01_011303 [Botrytis porri]TGO84458.1 hypothetical protein BPOR_0502g00010 [Botrytis porri]
MKPSTWDSWTFPKCDRFETFAPRNAHILECDFCGNRLHNESDLKSIADTPHNFAYWEYLHYDHPDKLVPQDTPCEYRTDFCGHRADYSSAEEAYAPNYALREEKLRNEILWDGTPPVEKDGRLTSREIIGEDTYEKIRFKLNTKKILIKLKTTLSQE